MQIHELFQSPKKVNEDLSSFFGLNNPAVKQAWDQLGGELIQNLSARFTKDPRYANMPLEQRKKAIAQDQAVQEMSRQKYEEWQKYITAVETKARGTPLTDQQYQAAFLNWATQSIFGNKFNSLDPAIKANAQEYFTQFVSHRGDPDAKRRAMFQTNILASLIADETARAVQVATDLQKTQVSLDAKLAQADKEFQDRNAAGIAKLGAMPNAELLKIWQEWNSNPVVKAELAKGGTPFSNAVKAELTKRGLLQPATNAQPTTNAPVAGTPQIGMPAGVPQPTTNVQPTATSSNVRGAQPGAPTPAELQKFDQLVAKAAKA